MRDKTGDIDEVEAARAQEYALLSTLLARAPAAVLLERLADLRCDASLLGRAHAGVAKAASHASAPDVEQEYFNLFIGVGRGSFCLMARIISRVSCRNGRLRACARTWSDSELSERRVRRSR